MFVPLFMIVFLWVLYLAATSGPRKALWVGWMTIMILSPIWLGKDFGSLHMDLRTGAAAAVVTGFIIFHKGNTQFRWLWLDTFILLLVATQVASGFGAGEIRPLTVPEILRRWIPAYLMGRLFFQSTDDLDQVLPFVSKLLLAICLYAIFEAILKINPFNLILGKHYAVLEAGEGYRWGLKRAQGPLDHPIFFGMTLVMLFPWALEAARQARHKAVPRWWLLLPPLMLGSIFCTVSRGAIVAVAFTVYVTYFFRRPKYRLVMLLVLMVAGLGVFFGKDTMIHALSKAAGESEQASRLIIVDGEYVEYTGTTHRLLLYKVYRKAIQEAGFFGYGGLMRGVPVEKDLLQRFGSIDNHYLLFLLQRGYMGIGCFLAVSICALTYLGIMAWDPKHPDSGFAAALFGGLAAVAILLTTVWFALDFAVVWLFCAGLSGSLYCLPRNPTKAGENKTDRESRQNADSLMLPRKLVPGWAPDRNPNRNPPAGAIRL